MNVLFARYLHLFACMVTNPAACDGMIFSAELISIIPLHSKYVLLIVRYLFASKNSMVFQRVVNNLIFTVFVQKEHFGEDEKEAKPESISNGLLDFLSNKKLTINKSNVFEITLGKNDVVLSVAIDCHTMPLFVTISTHLLFQYR
jgi:hypothetical protein